MDSPMLKNHKNHKREKTALVVRMKAVAFPFGSFGTTAAQQEQFLMLGIGIAVAITLMWLWAVLKKRRAHQAERKQYVNTMLDMMRALMARSARLDVFPSDRQKNSMDIMFSGVCSGCDEELMRLDVGLKPGMTEWLHPAVDVFFQSTEKGQVVFYSFRAEVREAVVNGPRLLMALPLPVKLNREQKRDFFRITPLSSVVRAMALWPVDAEQAWLGEISGRSLGKPVYGFRPGKMSQVILEDISAGGVRLGFESSHHRSLGHKHTVGDNFILLTVLTDASGEGSQQYWFNCLCVHTEQSVGRTEPVVGLQFQAWCVTERLTDALVWESMGDGGDVPPLSVWLTRYVRDRKAEKRAEKSVEKGGDS